MKLGAPRSAALQSDPQARGPATRTGGAQRTPRPVTHPIRSLATALPFAFPPSEAVSWRRPGSDRSRSGVYSSVRPQEARTGAKATAHSLTDSASPTVAARSAALSLSDLARLVEIRARTSSNRICCPPARHGSSEH